MKAFQRRRLLKLADFLSEMPRAKFNFRTIFEQGSKPPLEALAAGEHKCGTVGCAIGWMPAALPSVAKWDYYKSYNDEKKVANVVLREDERLSDFHAAARAFGITQSEAFWLFSPFGGGGQFGASIAHGVDGRATPKQVARHIRKFVERYAEVGATRNV